MARSHKNLPKIELKILNSGWVNTHKGMMLAGGGRQPFRVPAMFALIRHPSQGVILYDTGYHTRFFEVTSVFPYSLLKIFTPAEIAEEQNAVKQLEKAGIAADEVKTIILGHGHVDHVPGVKDFPKAKVILDRREWVFMQKPALSVFLKGFVKPLYDGISDRVELVNFMTQGKRCGPFDTAIDLFNDGSMIMTPLPGHTAGQMGLLVNMSDGKRFFFIGDAAWLSENYLKVTPPSFLARSILYSYRSFLRTLHFLHDFHEEYPEVTIVPSHCPAVWENLQKMGMTM